MKRLSIAPRWRNSKELAGVKSQVRAAINRPREGSDIVIDSKTALNLVEVCDQAIHTERGHEQP